MISQSVTSTSTAATSIDSLDVPDLNDPAFSAFASVFAHFQQTGEDGYPTDQGPSKGEVYYSDEEDEDEESRARAAQKAMEQDGMTRRQRRAAAVGPSDPMISAYVP
jgi:splicing factor 3B subunit 2